MRDAVDRDARFAAEVLNTSYAQFEVVGHLGLPGQALVRTTEGSPARAALAMAKSTHLEYFEPDDSVRGLGQVFPDEQQESPADFQRLIGLHNDLDTDIDAPEAWALATGSRKIVVGIVDTGIDYTHPDLYLNIFLNQGEIPLAKFDPAAPHDPAKLRDVDGDGLITFVDLNDPLNAAHVTDRVDDDNDYIEAGDLLADPTWANGVNEDGNMLGGKALADDLVGWDFRGNTDVSGVRRPDNDPFDSHGHGTHVAGVIGATGDNSLGVAGVNWEVLLLPVRFLSESNVGQTADAVAALNYLRQMSEQGANVRVVNNSWETSESTGLRDAVEGIGDREILVVAGAGNGDFRRDPNDNDATPVFPASFDDPRLLSVTGTDSADMLVPFYNYGATSVDLAAPSLASFSTEPEGRYDTRSGTSFATALVSGTAALAASQLPADATAAELRQAILLGVDALPSLQGKTVSGGRLNALGTLATDAYHPRAQLQAEAILVETRGVAMVEFEVEFQDNVAVSLATLDDGDVVIQLAGGGPELPATLVSTVEEEDGPTVRATYRVAAPMGVWDLADNGEYHILLKAGQVLDTADPANDARPRQVIAAEPQRLGALTIDVPPPGTFDVNSTDDTVDVNPGDGVAADAAGAVTLRAAVMEANAQSGQNTIRLPEGVFALTIAGSLDNVAQQGDLDLTDATGPLTIVGKGPGKSIIDAASLDRVFDIMANVSINLRLLTIRGGQADMGGGVMNRGALVLEEVVVQDNHATTFGGGIYHETGTLTIDNSTIRLNTAGDEGGGVKIRSGTATITGSEIRGNTAANFGGGLTNDGSLSLADTLIVDNAAALSGGGSGGGLALAGPTQIDSSEIRDNVVSSDSIGRDLFEPNDTLVAAIDRGGGDQTISGLTVHESDNHDFFRWTAESAGTLRVDLFFTHGAGDLDLYLRRPDGTVLAQSISSDDDETASVAVAAGESVIIQVVGYDGALNSSYDLEIDGPARPAGLAADGFEPNDVLASPFNLRGGDQSLSGLTIHAANNRDFFRWQAPASGPLTIDLTFAHVEGDLDMRLRNQSGTTLAISQSSTDNEQIVRHVNMGEVFFIEVYGYNGATHPSYDFAIDGPDASSLKTGGGVWIGESLTGAATPVTIRNTRIVGNNAETGGGIANDFGGKLTIEDSVITRNQAVSRSAALLDFDSYTSGGGIYTADKLTLIGSEVSENEAAVGAGIEISPAVDDVVTIDRSLITRNTAKQLDYSAGGGIRNGNGGELGGTLIITDSTISDNFSRFEGGGLTNGGVLQLIRSTISGNEAALGGGLSNWNQATIESSTISGNHASDEPESVIFGIQELATPGTGGGLYNIYVPFISTQSRANVTMSILNSTVTDNTADFDGGGIVADAAKITAENSIISGNRLSDDQDNDILAISRFFLFSVYGGSFVSQGENVVGPGYFDADSSVAFHASDVVSTSPGLAPLGEYGGPTRTHLPLPGSPAIDSGDLAGIVSSDQRGVTRPQDGNSNGTITADAGAVERYHGEIRGRVFHDLDGDRIRDAGEPPLTGWTVFLDANENGQLDAGETSTRTDVNGQYIFPLVLPGTYHVADQRPSELFMQTYPGAPAAPASHTILVKTGQIVQNVNFGNLAEVGEIRGQVFSDPDDSGVKEPGELGLPQWEVFLDANGNGAHDSGEMLVETDAQGRYVFPNLSPGDYVVEQRLKEGWERTTPLPGERLNVDFSDGAGDGDLEGFVVEGGLDGWHLTTTRAQEPGHSPGDSVYFGSSEGTGGSGSYRANTRGALTSPPIDLTDVSGTVRLRFNQFADVADVDLTQVNVLTDEGVFPLADSQAGSLSGETNEFEEVVLDLSAFARKGERPGQVVQVQFVFASDLVEIRQESLVVPVVAGQAYFLELNGPAGATHPGYSLTLDAPGILADRFEPNDGFAAAADLGVVDLVSELNLTLHPQGGGSDVDFYRFVPAGSGVIEIDLLFEHALGDIDAQLYNDAHEVISSAISGNDNERMRVSVVAGQTYYLEVSGFLGATHPHYDLLIDAPGAHADRFEPNDSFAAATNLGVVTDRTESLLTIHHGAPDFYRFVADSTGPATVRIEFEHDGGDLDLRLYNSAQTLLFTSESTTDDEVIALNAVAGETYFIKVEGFDGALNPNYRLVIDAPGISPDAFEDNESFGAAANLGNLGYRELTDLTINVPGDRDFFRFVAQQTGNLRLDLRFDQTRGDVDLFVYDNGQNQIATTQREGWFIDDVRIEATGRHELTLEAGVILDGAFFGNLSQLGATGVGLGGALAGRVYFDANGNRMYDPDEPGLPGVEVWLDHNNNKQVEPGEVRISREDDPQTPNADEAGWYEYTGVAPATFNLALRNPTHQTFPVANIYTPQEFRVGAGPQSVTVADFDGVNGPDVAAANASSHTVSVLLAQANGGFPEEGVSLSVGPIINQPTPVFITHGDIDNANGPDLIVANFRDDSVSIFLNDGAGGFGAAPIVAGGLGGAPTAIAVGRFNRGDEHLDLAVAVRATATTPGTVVLLLGDGQVGFPQASRQSYTVGVSPESIIAGFFNDDDDLDLAVAHYGRVGNPAANPAIPSLPGGATVLLNRAGMPGNVFAPQAVIETEPGAYFITAGEFDGAAGEDLAIANPVRRQVSVHLGDGAGAFPTAATLNVGLVTSVKAVDLDQDGDVDLVATNATDADGKPTVSLARNLGQGVFEVAESETFGIGALQGAPNYSISAADLNGDGVIDLAVAKGNNATIRTLLGQINAAPHRAEVQADQRVEGLDFGVLAPNEPPTLDQPEPVVLNEDAPEFTLPLAGISAGAEETQDLRIEVAQIGGDPGLFAQLTVIYTSPAATGEIKLAPAAQHFGTATIAITVIDAGFFGDLDTGFDNGVLTRTVTVTVNPVNDSPTFTKGADVTVDEDAGAQTRTNWASAIKPGPDNEATQSLTFEIVGNSNPALFAEQPALDTNGMLTFKALDDAHGGAAITVRLKDNGGTAQGGVNVSATQTFTITVNQVNDAPSFTKGADVTVDEDAGMHTVANWASAIKPGPDNEAAQTLTFEVINNSNPGLFVAPPAIDADGTLTFRAADDAHGAAAITVQLKDNGGTARGGVDVSGTRTFNIVVNAVNDSPSFAKGGDITIDEDAGPQNIANWATQLSSGPANEAGQTLIFEVINNSNPALFALPPAIAANGALAFKPQDDAHGTATVTIRVKDSGGTTRGGIDVSATQTFAVVVNPVNDPPSFASSGNVNVTEDAGTQSFANWASAIQAGPANEAGQTLAFEVLSNSNLALFAEPPAIDALGRLTFKTHEHAHGVATLAVRLKDNGGTNNGGIDASAAQTFDILVSPVNDPPSFVKGPDVSVDETETGEDYIFPNWAMNIAAGPADETGQSLMFQVVGNSNPGLFSTQPTIDPDGVLRFGTGPDASGAAILQLVLKDNGGGDDTSAVYTFVVNVLPGPDAPVFLAGPDQQVAEDAGPQTVRSWATNISPSDANDLRFVILSNSNPALFSAGPAVSPQGELSYTPAVDGFGQATIVVQLTDGQTASTAQSFEIEVLPVNDPPSFTKGGAIAIKEDAGLQNVANWATQLSSGPANEAAQTLTFEIANNSNPALFAQPPEIDAQGALAFRTRNDAHGTATITIRVKDNGGTDRGGVDISAAQTFDIIVSPVNDSPSFAPGSDIVIDAARAAQDYDFPGWATNISVGPPDEQASQTPIFEVAGNTNPALFSQPPVIDANGTLRFTAAANASGMTEITLVLRDGTGNGEESSPAETFTITIEPRPANERYDVNTNGAVGIDDLLAIVTYLRVHGLSSPAPEGGPLLPDVNLDTQVSLSDLIEMINHLRSRPASSASGEGEREDRPLAPLALRPGSATDSPLGNSRESAIDFVFASSDDEED